MTALRGKTVLVTGAAGFVGNHLVEALVDDNTVIALDHFRTNSRDRLSDEATIVEGDVRDESTLRKAVDGRDVDVVFHQAAAADAASSVEDPFETQTVNVDATIRLLQVAREIDARVILASSASVYGHPTELPTPETARKRPTSPYGVQKLAVDQYGRLWHDLHDLETVVLRYFNVYGQRATDTAFRGIVGTFIEQARDAEITVVGDGTQTRDLVHVSDVVQANLRAATTEHVGRAYNVGSGTRTEIGELARLVRDHVNPDAELTHTAARQWDVCASQADLTRARNRLGYEPTVDLRSCLRRRKLDA